MYRRKLLLNSAALAGGTLLIPAMAKANLSSPNDTLGIGVIGCNGMGWSNLNAMLKSPGTRCVALCDVDANVLQRRKDELAKRDIAVTTYADHRKLLENKDVDLVIIGTPDHWHCLQMVDACEAGKHVYVEKPAGNSIAECQAMVAAQQRTGRIVQVGQWQRSNQHFADAAAFVQSGKLGNVRLVKAWAYQGWMKPVPIKPDEPAPAGVDYARWLGPAQKRPFNANRFHFNFRWFWDYAGGLMTDWGVHMVDYALLGMNAAEPISIMASGGKMAYPDDASETPDTLTTVYQFPKFNMLWEHATGINGGPYGRDHGVAYIGNNGTLVVNRGGWEVIPEKEGGKDRMEPISLQKPSDNGLELHTRNFLDAIRNNDPKLLKCSIQDGTHVAVVCQMGNIAYKAGEKLHWNAQARKFNENAANKYLAQEYHNGYKMPSVK